MGLSRPPNEYQQDAYTLAFSRDGKYVAVADVEVMIFEVKGWKHVATLRGHSDHVRGIAFTPDNSKLITGAWDGTLCVWDLTTRKELRRISDDVSGFVAVTRDGKTAIGDDKEGRLTAWNVETGKPLYRCDEKMFWRSLYSIGRRHPHRGLVTRSAVVVYDARTGKCLSPHARPDIPPANDRLLVEGQVPRPRLRRTPNDIRLWEVASGMEVRRPGRKRDFRNGDSTSNEVREMLLLTREYAGRPAIEIWNLTKRKRVAVLPKRAEVPPVRSLRRTVWSTGQGKTFIEWNTPTDRVEWRISLPKDVAFPQLLLSADERVLLAWRDGRATSWSTITAKQLSSLPLSGNDRPMAISSDGKDFVSAGGPSTYLRNVRSGKVLLDFGGNQFRVAAFSPDGRLIAVSDHLGAVQLWDAKTRRRVRCIEGHRDVVTKLIFSPDGRHLASASSDTTILVWDVRKLAPGGK